VLGDNEFNWARRVPPEKVRRLYVLESKGIIDDGLIDEVGYGLFWRCQSIRDATLAHSGRAPCARCGAVIPHQWDKAQELQCDDCGWKTTWGLYLKSYQGKQLHGGTAHPAFLRFVAAWPLATTSRDKLFAIDRLIHACHGWGGGASRPAGANVIEGTSTQVIRLLDELAYGPSTPAEVIARRVRWRDESATMTWLRRNDAKAGDAAQ
jgi:hypothetical protein